MRTRMRIALVLALAMVLAVSTIGVASAKQAKTVTTVGADASEWSSSTAFDPFNGIYPVGGSGQLNGEFTIAERDGIQLGLRATDRTDGLLTASGKKKGVYHASTGYDDAAMTVAEWNYDIHLDLRGTGTTLADYEFTFHQTFTPKLGGVAGPVDLDAAIPPNAVLFQTSQNPVFGNDTFDPTAEGTHNLMLKLTPKDGGPPLAVQIKVVVSD